MTKFINFDKQLGHDIPYMKFMTIFKKQPSESIVQCYGNILYTLSHYTQWRNNRLPINVTQQQNRFG